MTKTGNDINILGNFLKNKIDMIITGEMVVNMNIEKFNGVARNLTPTDINIDGSPNLLGKLQRTEAVFFTLTSNLFTQNHL